MLRARRGWVRFGVSVTWVCHSVALGSTYRYVNQNRLDGCSGTQDGTYQLPFCKIQDAITAAQGGDTIEVVGADHTGRRPQVPTDRKSKTVSGRGRSR